MKFRILQRVLSLFVIAGLLAGCSSSGDSGQAAQDSQAQTPQVSAGSGNAGKIRLSFGAELSAGAQFPFWTQYAGMIQKYSDQYEITVAETGGF